ESTHCMQRRLAQHFEALNTTFASDRLACCLLIHIDGTAAGWGELSVTIAAMVAAHRAGAASPAATIAQCYARIRAHRDPTVFISLREEADAIAEAKALAAPGAKDLPLYGVPVAVKDNIDVKGMPTTAACPAFSYEAAKDATCVARLKRAGAIVVGKTNL